MCFISFQLVILFMFSMFPLECVCAAVHFEKSSVSCLFGYWLRLFFIRMMVEFNLSNVRATVWVGVGATVWIL